MGVSKMACIGCLTSLFKKMPVAHAASDHSQQTFVVLRHMALNLLKHERTAKCGIKAKRRKAGWSEDYLRQVLTT
jgi:hypothetical protein